MPHLLLGQGKTLRPTTTTTYRPYHYLIDIEILFLRPILKIPLHASFHFIINILKYNIQVIDTKKLTRSWWTNIKIQWSQDTSKNAIGECNTTCLLIERHSFGFSIFLYFNNSVFFSWIFHPYCLKFFSMWLKTLLLANCLIW